MSAFLRVAAAGGCATLLGVGLQRFAYAPLLPAMVGAGWLGPGAAGALGAANLAGYLLGAALAPALARRVGLRPALRGAMLAAASCFALCALPGGLAWFLPWRVLAGAAGGVLMVLAGPAVQQAVPPERRGRAAGVVFAGVGTGVVAGALLVPALLPAGLPAAWLALSAAGLGLAALSWRWWPDVPAPARVPAAARGAGPLLACYALAAAAATPHMVWWPDYVARGLGFGAAEGALLWAAYGLAAACGPALCGRAADRFGARRVLPAALLVQAGALGLPLLHAGAVPPPGAVGPLETAALLLSSAGAGATAIGLSALTLTRAREVAGEGAPGVWRTGTALYGAAQTGCGFALAWLYARTGSHLPLFGVGLAAGLLAVPFALVGRGAGRARGAPG